RILGAVDQNNSIRFTFGQLAVRLANLFVKFGGLLFHAVRFARAPLHSRLRRCEIDVENEGTVGNAIAHCGSVQLLNYFSLQLSGRTLVNGGGIEKTI